MKKKRVPAVLLTALLLVCTVFPAMASANSARTHWTGVSRTGTIITDVTCPIVVQKELLTFDIQQLPERYYSAAKDYLAYTGSVTAEYTFHNPADYSVTAKLLFPFGNIPDYGMLHDPGTNQPMYRTDSEKYGVAINGERIEAVLRHSFAYPFDEFALETDVERLHDGYISDPFYDPDLPVTKYLFHAENVDHEAYGAATAAITLPFGKNKTKYVMVENNGFELLEEGFRLSTFIGHREAGNKITLYVIGEQPNALPEWKFYENGACEKEIDGTMILDNTEYLTFNDVAMRKYPTDTECSPEDWYNALIIFMNTNEYADGFVGNDFAYGDGVFDINRCLMRWYEYEITLEAGQTITNTVTAPMYPDIDGSYEPSVYSYGYLLSPAKTWKEFGALDIIIRTPFYLTDSSLKGFHQGENEYTLSLDGLPEGELNFSLSSAEKPSVLPKVRQTGAWILYLGKLLILMAIPATAIVLLVLKFRKRIRK